MAYTLIAEAGSFAVRGCSVCLEWIRDIFVSVIDAVVTSVTDKLEHRYLTAMTSVMNSYHYYLPMAA